MSIVEKKENCTGCGACAVACPVNCIKMQEDEEGFVYPVISDECIKCNKCEKVCHVINPNEIKKQTHIVYAATTYNHAIWKRSASGGAFSEICFAYGDKDTLICGAAWDGYDVKHISVTGVKNIGPLCKSKYVFSSTENTYKEVENHLKNGGKAIYCGTPCQISGLRSYLGKEYDNLLLIDLICHGVGSPSVFKTSINNIGKQFGKKVSSYEFRSKRNVFETDHLSKISFDDGTDDIYLTKDQYIQLFLKQNCLRPSCGENCRFRNEQRQGDITIADFKGLGEVFPELAYEKKNFSTIVFNTDKGLALTDKLDKTMKLLRCSVEDLIKYNPLFARHTWSSKDRDAFFEDFVTDNDNAVKKWTSPAFLHRVSIQRRLYDVLPTCVRRIMFKIFRGEK